MRGVHVLFYKPSPEDHWLNTLVTKVSPPFSHCDIQFENDIASSIYQNENVYMCQKSFARMNYERISLTFSDDEYNKIFDFCESHCKRGTSFDLMGMIGSYIPLYNFKPRDKTFCSRFVVEALQASGKEVFYEMNAIKTSPSSLFKFLNQEKKTFLHISSKRLCNIK